MYLSYGFKKEVGLYYVSGEFIVKKWIVINGKFIAGKIFMIKFRIISFLLRIWSKGLKS